ncbi:MAG TPA: DNA integration/recombination/inversion protein, partial [Polyangiaceae bacterium]|nr:DNA integration/recombination/inversion protein [Polyangiaceae bacterium]
MARPRGGLRAHDLRGTFVTLSLANGKTETWLMDRTEHTTSAMLNRYRPAARSASELGLGPLLPLSAAIPEIAELVSKGGPRGGPKKESPSASSQGKEPQPKTKAEVAEWQTRRIQ